MKRALLIFGLLVAWATLASAEVERYDFWTLPEEEMQSVWMHANAAVAAPAISIDSAVTPCVTESGATSVPSETCGLTGITLGDTLICSLAPQSEQTTGGLAYVSDSLNGAIFNVPRYYNGTTVLNVGGIGIAYLTNSLAGSDTITIFTGGSDNYLSISCSAWKNIRATNAIDGGAINAINALANGSNPSLSSSVTPSQNGELVFGEVQTTNDTTPTAGAGFTVIGNMPVNTQVPEYQIQTTATATDVPYTEATSDSWTELTTAFIPVGGTPGVTPLTGVYSNASGGTNGTTPTSTTMNSSTVSTVGPGNPAFTVNAGSSITFSNSVTLNCLHNSVWINGTLYSTSASPLVYQFATGTASLGLAYNTAGATFNSVTIAYCIETSLPQTDSSSNRYSLPSIQAGDSSDYCNPQIVPTGTALTLALESPEGGASGTLPLATNTVLEVQFNYTTNAGGCSMALYNAGTQVGSTITASSHSGSHPATFLGIAGVSGAEAESSGFYIWFGYFRASVIGTFPLPL